MAAQNGVNNIENGGGSERKRAKIINGGKWRSISESWRKMAKSVMAAKMAK
jgi:hypothetical protein